ncbi:MAG TPA: phosphatase PAP2 family protein [Acidimicrobiales bacterium]|jgi:undecaprenyl-diphosphatase|nr:phosphatase PAP2 family protein [Acidimicrobiales bacterium]
MVVDAHTAARYWRPELGRVLRAWAAGYVVLTTIFLAVGFFLTRVLWDLGLDTVDGGISHWFARNRSSAANHVASVMSETGNTVPIIVVAALLTVALARERRWHAAAVPAVALTLELAVFLTTNYVVARARPDVPIGPAPSTYSYPSGHSAAAVALYAGGAVLAARYAWPWFVRGVADAAAVLVPAGVGLARVYEGMHFTSDVLAGYALGAGSLATALVATRLVRPGRSLVVETARDREEVEETEQATQREQHEHDRRQPVHPHH